MRVRRQNHRLMLLCSTFLFSPAYALAADGESIMQKGGNNPAVLPCMACHGPDGKGMQASGFPRLAGLPEAYITKQLQDFKAGSRQNPLMQPIASALSDEEVAAVAKAYSERPKTHAGAASVDRPLPGSGAWIALRGNWDRSIPECTLCHGPSGIGVGVSFPPLAGQSAGYIEAQLRAWRGTKAVAAGKKTKATPAIAPTRHNDPNGLMQHIAADLSDDEIKAVAGYFGSLDDTKEPIDESQHRLR